MKNISVIRLSKTGKRKTVVPGCNNIRILKGEILYYIEHLESYETINGLDLKLVIDGKEWNLPSITSKELERYDINDSVDHIFRELERILDLHEAFYED